VFLVNLERFLIVNQFLTILGTIKLIVVFIISHKFYPLWANTSQSSLSYSINLRFILLLFSHFLPDLLGDPFSCGLFTETLYATSPLHQLLDQSKNIWQGIHILKLRIKRFHKPPIIFCPLVPNRFHSITSSSCFFLEYGRHAHCWTQCLCTFSSCGCTRIIAGFVNATGDCRYNKF
jgi:hypothetical protein